MSKEEHKPDFDDLPYDSSKLQDLWDVIQTILTEQGRLCGDELADEASNQYPNYGRQTIRNDILPKMRQALNSQQFISVNTVPGEDDKIVKKEWVIE